jgi:class 3 adenylate cyclase/GTPase SAR1 family protein
VWLDKWTIQPGDSIPLKIQQGLEQSRILLMCMSPAYFASDWGALEHMTLFFRDPKNEQRRFIPLLMEDCTRPDIVAHFAYIDWRRQSDEAYKRLLAACGEDAPEKASHKAAKGKADRMPVVLKGHTGIVSGVTVTPDGKMAISTSYDKTLKVWNLETGRCKATFEGHTEMVLRAAVTPDGKTIVSGSEDNTLRVWDLITGSCRAILEGHTGGVNCLGVTPDGKTIVSGSDDNTLRVWDLMTGRCKAILEGHTEEVLGLAVIPDGKTVVSGSEDNTLRVWDLIKGMHMATFEGHTNWVSDVVITPDGKMVVSASYDNTLRVWDLVTGSCRATLEGHPDRVLAVAVTPDGKTVVSASCDYTLRIWNLGASVMSGQVTEPGTHYVNAKVVLVGDTGVGKTGLSLVLNNLPFAATDSTPGRRVWTLDSSKVKISDDVTQTRETLLWDLAGQPGYRVIHQLHLNEVAVALVVFDARSEIDPLAGVRHWERALRLAQQRQGSSCVPMKKYLVSARNDRGGVSIGEDRLKTVLKDFGFDGYFKTSAKEGWQIRELRDAIGQAIPWEELPEVSSSQLFADIKSYLLDEKKTGLLLAPVSQLYDEYASQHPEMAIGVKNLRDQFETCIGRLENRDLIRRLTFGGYVLLQPELLDAYASAMVITAKDEPDGLGSMAEEVALAGRFFVPKEQKVSDPGQEQLLLHATVEELVLHDLALRENADDGRYLVFPSQFNRDYEDAPEPKGKAVAITFDGPVQSIYATLAVRLGHSGLFTTGRAEMWRNAAIFTAKAGGKCGLFLNEFDEARGRLILFFNEEASPETRFHFEEFVMAHAKRRALQDSIELVRFFVCSFCGDPVPDSYVKRLRERGKTTFECACGRMVSLVEPKERIHFESKVEAMDRSADRHRDFDAFVVSAKGEMITRSFRDWAGGERVTLAIVFTDVVGSTSLGVELRDEAMNEVRRAHFAQTRRLIERFDGREIKNLGDGFLVAFKSADAALNYALALQKDTGHPQIKIRAGIHIGPMQVEGSDVFGDAVNFAARVIGFGGSKGKKICLSDRAKKDIDGLGSAQHKQLQWEPHEGVALKGYPGTFTLWSLRK